VGGRSGFSGLYDVAWGLGRVTIADRGSRLVHHSREAVLNDIKEKSLRNLSLFVYGPRLARLCQALQRCC